MVVTIVRRVWALERALFPLPLTLPRSLFTTPILAFGVFSLPSPTMPAKGTRFPQFPVFLLPKIYYIRASSVLLCCFASNLTQDYWVRGLLNMNAKFSSWLYVVGLKYSLILLINISGESDWSASSFPSCFVFFHLKVFNATSCLRNSNPVNRAFVLVWIGD